MSAHTLVSVHKYAESTTGEKPIMVTFTGSASYDTGGSTLDLSAYASTVTTGFAQAQGSVLQARVVPTSSTAAAATLKIMLVDKDGTEESSADDMHTTTYVAYLNCAD